MRNVAPVSFAALVQEFFTEYLTRQRALSPCTVAVYRDAFLLFLAFAEAHLGKAPTALELADVSRELLAAFLDHLETERNNSVRTRNARLAAIRSFLTFAGRSQLGNLHTIQQALAVPMKRFDRPMLGFLARDEMQSLIAAPDTTTWLGQRDRLLLMLLYNTGARVSEITGVRVGQVILHDAPCIHLHGKGRKQRSVPLWAETTKAIRAWLRLNRQPGPDSPLLPTRAGRAMTRANVAQRVRLAVRAAATTQPHLAGRSISPHTIRHTTAMHLLQSGVDITVIALWLGHESPTTTHMYVEANLAMKAQALARLAPPNVREVRYRPPDTLLRFLQAL
jgi:site-specific recombinase XerD